MKEIHIFGAEKRKKKRTCEERDVHVDDKWKDFSRSVAPQQLKTIFVLTCTIM